MKNSFKIYPVISIVLLMIICEIQAASYIGPADTSILVSTEFSENLYVFTDRNLYATGEKCLFTVFRTGSNPNRLAGWSKVIYLELLHADGKPVKHAKYYITGGEANGAFNIPENLLSGYYYLRAYTRWMRNFSSSGFGTVRLKIFNPFETKVESADRADIKNNADTTVQNSLNIQKGIVQCRAENSKYGIREPVKINFDVFGKKLKLPENYCITVIKTGAIDTINYGILRNPSQNESESFPLRFIPDIRGLSLTGRLVDKSTGAGIANTHIALSVLGEYSDFYNYMTQEDGSFVFALRGFHGTSDMYISLLSNTSVPVRILVDNEYANGNSSFDYKPFMTDEQELAIANEIVFNSQVTRAYQDQIPVEQQGEGDVETKYFYGKSANSIYMSDFIDLPTIDEVLFELVRDISVVKKKDGYYLRNNGFYTDVEIFKPLILIDNILVSDVGALLKMSPEKIERIDVIDRIYAKGDYLYGGVLNLISKKSDFGGITLPEYSYFFNYDGFAPQHNIKFPTYKNQSNESRIPDFRNCLYWNPAFNINQGSANSIEFYTSDSKGNYIVLIRGVTSEGKIFEGGCTFLVE